MWAWWGAPRSLLPGVAGPLLQAPPLPMQPFSPDTTYIAIVASDGDNLQARMRSPAAAVYSTADEQTGMHMHASTQQGCGTSTSFKLFWMSSGHACSQ